jgi:hypothetical protein
MSSKDLLKSLQPQLYSNRQSQDLVLVKEWLLASIEELKERALTVEPTGLASLQGEAKAHKRLLRTITEKPHNVD